MGTELPSQPRYLWLLALALVVLAAGIPLTLYWAVLGRSPSISAAEARRQLALPGSLAVLVDVRDAAERVAAPLPEAAPWPATNILALRSPDEMPAEFRDRPLLLLCSSGLNSALAVQRLRRLGLTSAVSVRGGYQSWIAAEPAGEALQTTPPAEQFALVAAVFPLKLIYMAVALAAIVLLWGQSEIVLAALRWSMLFFLAGELFCWVNIVAFNEESVPLEFLHSWGMVACLGFLAFAAVEAVDRGLIHYSDPRARCAFAGLCRGCAKTQDTPCLVLRLFKWTLPCLAVVALMPLTVQPAAVSYNTRLFSLVRNLMHPVIIQLYESRFAPVAAISLLAVAWLLLLAGGRSSFSLLLSKVFLSAGLGHLGFGLMRVTLLAYFRSDLTWFVFWEEATELVLTASVVFVVWVFQARLIRRAAVRTTS